MEDVSWGDSIANRQENKTHRAVVPLVAGIALVMLSGTVASLHSISTDNQSPAFGANNGVEEPDSQDNRHAAISLLERFLALDTNEERLKLVRNPDETAAKMRDFYRTSQISPVGGIRDVAGAKEIRMNRRMDVFWMHYLLDDAVWRTAVFEKTSSGLKIDWESLVAYEPIAWPHFIEDAGGNGETFRLTLTEDDYFNFRYAASDEFRCFRLQHTGRSETAWGYSKVGTSVDAELARLFERAAEDAKSSINITVKLEFISHSDGSTHAQALLQEIVSDGWFVP